MHFSSIIASSFYSSQLQLQLRCLPSLAPLFTQIPKQVEMKGLRYIRKRKLHFYFPIKKPGSSRLSLPSSFFGERKSLFDRSTPIVSSRSSLNFLTRSFMTTSSAQCEKGQGDKDIVNGEEEEERKQTKDTNSGKQIAIFGGNGYVGGHIIQSLLARDDVDNIMSISRSGLPNNHPYMKETWAHDQRIQWLKGDLLEPETYKSLLKGKNGVISAVGAFGNNETMEKFNGDANINAAKTANEVGVENFVYISTSENNLPQAFLKGYFNGKKRAEETVLDLFEKNGYILRPSFVYGTRKITVNGKIVSLPLEYIGRPLEMLFRLPPFPTLKDSLPGAKALLVPPISVKAVANVAAKCACNDLEEGGILTVEDIAYLCREG